MNCYRCANETQDGKYTGTTKPHAIRNSSSDSDSDSDHNSDLNSTRDVDWKPATLKTKFHIANIFLCILFVAIIEILLRLSNKRGGLVFADEHTGYLPSYTLFCFEYLPTIIGVLHGLIWSTFDHDIKRLEPFYQLSVPEGVNAENSLLLDYPYQFPILVLVNAVRKRHWVVFCSGLMAILTAFAVTPMMSAIVTRETVNRTIEFEVSSNVILPMEHQAGNVSAMSAHLAYRYQHLDSPLPAFAMDTFGILPFSPLQKTVSLY